MPTVKSMEIEKILERRTTKRTRKTKYFEHLVKWQGYTVEDLTWITKQELQLQGFDLAYIEENSFVPRDFDARESRSNHSLVLTQIFEEECSFGQNHGSTNGFPKPPIVLQLTRSFFLCFVANQKFLLVFCNI